MKLKTWIYHRLKTNDNIIWISWQLFDDDKYNAENSIWIKHYLLLDNEGSIFSFCENGFEQLSLRDKIDSCKEIYRGSDYCWSFGQLCLNDRNIYQEGLKFDFHSFCFSSMFILMAIIVTINLCLMIMLIDTSIFGNRRLIYLL